MPEFDKEFLLRKYEDIDQKTLFIIYCQIIVVTLI